MHKHLKISVGQYTDKGIKTLNQDFHGMIIPEEPQLSLKGIVVAIADGISSSNISQIASETAIKNFLTDYYCTSDAWSVQTSGERVLSSINGWLYSQTQRSEYRYNKEKGYVCTFSAAIFKASTLHIFHIGDSRVYRLRNNGLEALTKDHRVWVSKDTSYLSKALGIELTLEADYQQHSLHEGDTYLVCTDGVYDFVEPAFILHTLNAATLNLDHAAKTIVKEAIKNGSDDNLTLQIIHIDSLASGVENSLKQQVEDLQLPPLLQAPELFDGYKIIRQLHSHNRSHVYLAEDIEEQTQVVIKTPSLSLSDDPAYLERFLMEEWVARLINNAHVMKAGMQHRERNYLYTVTEYIAGRTLKQWLIDNPKPSINTVRNIIEQIGLGLQAMHRKEILHQDLHPNNVMIEDNGNVKIIDFGSVKVTGIAEARHTFQSNEMLGTAMYMAPEYFIGDLISSRSDLYSLAVITYFMLSGRYPYGTQVAKSRTTAAQKRLIYKSVITEDSAVPMWIDATLQKALHPNPLKRYTDISEFIFDLHNPNPNFTRLNYPPLMARNPVKFWKTVSLMLALIVVILLTQLSQP